MENVVKFNKIWRILKSYLGLIRISDFLLREELDLQAVKHSIKLGN